jgi:hypothetical protein
MNNIKMGFREIGWVGMECTDLIEVRDLCRVLVSTVINLFVSQNSGKVLSRCKTGDSATWSK